MTALVLGAAGMLGSAIVNCFGSAQCIALFRKDYDLSKAEDIDAIFERFDFDVFINCAAYTRVDDAESDKTAAKQINADAIEYLAKACKQHDVLLVHFSTDYVFNGEKEGPFSEEDAFDPINYYGYTKLLGEQHIQAHCSRYYIFRVQWLYGDNGKHFLKTMCRLFQERDELTVVNDQFGSPTNVRTIAEFLKQFLQENAPFGIYHYSAEGLCSWYEYALFLAEELGYKGRIQAVPCSEFVTPAKRPKNGHLSTAKLKAVSAVHIPTWQEDVKAFLSSSEFSTIQAS